MSRLLALRTAIIDAIKVELPTFGVEGHLGRFTAADLSRFLTMAPAVRVAVLGVAEAKAAGLDGDEIDAVARVGVYVVTNDGRGGRLSRDEAAMMAVERISLIATGARWGLAWCRPALAPNAQNLFSDETLAKGAALWAIDLSQPLMLQREPGAEPDPLSELMIGVAPDIGPAHVADYLGPLPDRAGGADV